jgi:hypothetical protein
MLGTTGAVGIDPGAGSTATFTAEIPAGGGISGFRTAGGASWLFSSTNGYKPGTLRSPGGTVTDNCRVLLGMTGPRDVPLKIACTDGEKYPPVRPMLTEEAFCETLEGEDATIAGRVGINVKLTV